MIGIIDYGAGNLRSVKKAFDFLYTENKIITNGDEFNGIDRLVLPGVGSFGHAMNKINESGLFAPVREWLRADKPFLGICLGMQLLLESSEESPDVKGFGIFKGTNRKFQSAKVPQIGWNSIEKKKDVPLLDGLNSGDYLYFIHSYYVDPVDAGDVVAVTEYEIQYASMMGRGNVYAAQCHPEKSGDVGIALLRNWVKKVGA